MEHRRPLAKVHMLYIDLVLPILLPLPEVEQDARAQDGRQDDVETVARLVESCRCRRRDDNVRDLHAEKTVRRT